MLYPAELFICCHWRPAYQRTLYHPRKTVSGADDFLVRAARSAL